MLTLCLSRENLEMCQRSWWNLKWDKSSDAAIAQIKKKQYMQSLKDYHGQVILAGINYDSTDSTKDDYKRHSCSIEKINL